MKKSLFVLSVVFVLLFVSCTTTQNGNSSVSKLESSLEASNMSSSSLESNGSSSSKLESSLDSSNMSSSSLESNGSSSSNHSSSQIESTPDSSDVNPSQPTTPKTITEAISGGFSFTANLVNVIECGKKT